MIVSEVPGTTRDAIDTVLRRGDTTFVLVDTAGLRRKRKQRQGIEYYSELRALEAAERADVALVLFDASRGDRRAGSRRRRRRAQGRAARRSSCCRSGTSPSSTSWRRQGHLARRLRQRPPVIAVSAKTGRGVDRAARQGRGAVREAQRPDHDRRAEPRPRRAARRATRPAGRARAASEADVRHPGRARGRRGSASSSTPRASSRATTATGSRTSCASASSSKACRCRSTSSRASSAVRVRVVGGGSWGTALRACSSRDHGHDVTLACRDRGAGARDRARRAATRATSRTSTCTGIVADDDRGRRRSQSADLVVVAVPSASFRRRSCGAARRPRRCSP